MTAAEFARVPGRIEFILSEDDTLGRDNFENAGYSREPRGGCRGSSRVVPHSGGGGGSLAVQLRPTGKRAGSKVGGDRGREPTQTGREREVGVW